MKKVMTFVLAMLMVMSMAVSAFAVDQAPAVVTNRNYAVPVFSFEDDFCGIVSIHDPSVLSEAEREIFQEAEKGLNEDGMKVDYFFYHNGHEDEKLPCTHTFKIKNYEEVHVKQFENGEWVELKAESNGENSITVSGLKNCPVVIYVTGGTNGESSEDKTDDAVSVPSREAPISTSKKTALLPVYTGGTDDCRFVSIMEANQLPEEYCENFRVAQTKLKEATVDGMLTKYFFHHWNNGKADVPCTYTFDIGEFEDVCIKQFENNEWVELKTEVNEDGTVTVFGVKNLPIVILTK